MSIAMDASADKPKAAAPPSGCKQDGSRLTAKRIIEIAKEEISKREPLDPYQDIDARFNEDLCGWVVIATRTPEKPGATRHLLISKDGKLKEYLAGF